MFNMESLLSGMYCTRAAKVNRQICCSGGRETDKMEKAAEDGKCYKDNRKWEMGSGRKGIQFWWTQESLDPRGGIWAEGPEVVVHRLSAHCMWNLPGLRVQPVSPAFAARLLSPVPPGKSPKMLLTYTLQPLTPFCSWEKTNLTLPQGLCTSCSLARNILLLPCLHSPNSFLRASPVLFTCE